MDQQIQIDVAVLQTQHAAITKRLDDQNEWLGDIDSKIDKLVESMISKQIADARAGDDFYKRAFWGTAKYVAIIAVAVTLAKLKIPVGPGP